ncbi:GntR family transcriptional regulator [Martelella mangrovi]|uniref:GntR family transcriptional regulator n=1 Tax=Martelella mangrovi TaxID=1397477 RepID=A0ABV2ICD0_9HYPH
MNMQEPFKDIDLAGDGPLYRRLKAAIATVIARGDLESGAALPPERDLAELLGVSRVTVRRAIAELTSEGVLTRRHGAGTFVALPIDRIEQPLKRLTSFTEDMMARGLKPRSRWLERGLFPASPEEADTFGIAPGTEVARLSRIRFGSNRPMALEHTSLPGDIMDAPEAVGPSLYAALAERGIRPERANERITACVLNDEQADLLGVPSGSPALTILRTGFDAAGRVIEMTRSYYRSDIYDLVAELTFSNDE